MDSILKDFLTSGKAILADTKRPAVKNTKGGKVTKGEVLGEMEQDPHRILIRRIIREKPSKKEVVEQFKRFIDAAEAAL